MDKRAIVWVDTVLVPWIEFPNNPWNDLDKDRYIDQYYKDVTLYLKITNGKLPYSVEDYCDWARDID